MGTLANSYWGQNGRYQAAVDRLNELVPAEGSVPEPRKNRALERFRKASNCYYDLYNNGLCNRANEFYQVFGIASGRYKIRDGYGGDHHDRLYVKLEPVMDRIVLDAAIEQNLGLLTAYL